MESRFRDFRLGEYRISPLGGEIAGPSGKVHIQPKAMEVLLCLAESPGDLLTRAELQETVWGDTEYSNDLLTRCISELRHALDDDIERPRYIETVPRRGYRLVAKLERSGHDSAGSPESKSPRPPEPNPVGLWQNLQRRHVVRVIMAYALVGWLLLQIASVTFDALQLPAWSMTLFTVLLALGFPVAIILGWAYELTPEGVKRDSGITRTGPSVFGHYFDIVIISVLAVAVGILGYRVFLMETAPSVDGALPVEEARVDAEPDLRHSLAVLRFRNIGDAEEARHFSDGLGEQLLSFLSSMKELRVAARTSSWPLSDREDLDIPKICNMLKVGHVLAGSVQKSQDNIRVWAQLVDENGFHLWTDTYDLEFTADNVFAIQDRIAGEVTRHLKIALSDETLRRFGNRPTHDLEALDFHLRGQGYLRGVHSESTLKSAETLFQSAIDKDPRYASAYSGLCQTQLYFYELDSSVNSFEAAERSCHRALTLDSGLQDVYRSLGELYRRSGQFDKAEQEYAKALALNPDDGDALYGLARTAEALNDIERAEDLFKQAIKKQPGYWLRYNTYGTFLWRFGRRMEALEQYRIVTEMVPEQPVGYVNMATIYNPMGEFEKALELYQKSLDLQETRNAYTNIGLTYYRLGQFDKAMEMQGKAIAMAPEDHRAWGRLASAARHAGKQEVARTHYQEALSKVNASLEINPESASLRAYRGFYLAHLGQAEAAKVEAAAAMQLAPRAHEVFTYAARTYVAIGDNDRAMALIVQAVELGASRFFVAAEPDFGAFHGMEEFEALLPAS